MPFPFPFLCIYLFLHFLLKPAGDSTCQEVSQDMHAQHLPFRSPAAALILTLYHSPSLFHNLVSDSYVSLGMSLSPLI